jgi:hypothetical protein
LARQLRCGHPDFMMWLGAGASVSSGIPAAAAVVDSLLREAHGLVGGQGLGAAGALASGELKEWARANQWLPPAGDVASAYAHLLGRRFRAPGLLQEHLVDLVSRARPSLAYTVLGCLLRDGVFDTVITPNFDSLVLIGAGPELRRPLAEISDLADYPGLRPFPRFPRIIRVHGDFWHGNALYSEGEREGSTSIRFDAIRRLLHSYGLIVCGYSGSDSGIMSFFADAGRDTDALQKGLYWCSPRGESRSPLLDDFLANAPGDRVFFVEIESFDLLMRELAEKFGIVGELRSRASGRELAGLVFDLVEAQFETKTADLPEVQRAMLARIRAIAGGGEVACLCLGRSGWQVAFAERSEARIPDVLGVLAGFEDPREDYFRLMPGDPQRQSAEFWGAFQADLAIEVFTFRRGGRLSGLIAVGGPGCLMERLVKMDLATTARVAFRLLVNLPLLVDGVDLAQG